MNKIPRDDTEHGVEYCRASEVDSLAVQYAKLAQHCAMLEAKLAAPEQEPLTAEQYTALAHRIASKYAHRSDPKYIAYTFLPHTLEQFVRVIEAAHGIKGGA